MKIILETLRFILLFSVLSTVIGIITQITFLAIGIDPNKYGWIAIFIAFIFMIRLYKNKNWDKKFNKKILWTALISIALLTIFIPDGSPTHLHTDRYAYSYGLPFNFLTLYVEGGSKFLFPNILSGNLTDWSVSIGLFGNFVIFYLCLQFILKKQ